MTSGSRSDALRSTAAIDAIERIDNSFGEFGEQFRVHEQAISRCSAATSTAR
jgi:hypothetical protein